MMKQALLSLAMVAALVCSTANADIVVEYTTAGSVTSIAANSNSSSNVTGDALTAGPGLNVQDFSTFNFTGWDTANTDFASAVAAGDFWSWGFDVTSAGTTIQLTDLNVRLDRSGSGPDDFEIQASVNGGTPITVLTHDFMDSSAGVNFTTVDLSALGTVTTGDSVDFVLAAFNSESDLGSFDLETITFPDGTDSLQINGVITKAVPEPTSCLVVGLFAGVAISRRRR